MGHISYASHQRILGFIAFPQTSITSFHPLTHPLQLMAAHEVYREQLMANKLGVPLWLPEEPAYAGDVGYTYEGSFRRLFNIFHPFTANSELDIPNFPYGCPPYFKPWICEPQLHMAHPNILDVGGICSRNVKKATIAADATINPMGTSAGAAISFSCSRDQGALLVLNDSADLEGVVCNTHIEEYMLRNHDNWQKFIIAKRLGNYWDDVMLITATIKTSANWMVAAFVQKENSQELTLNAQVPAGGASGSVKYSFYDVVSRSVEHRKSPRFIAASDKDTETDPPLPKNQCVFLKGYKFKYKFAKVWPKVIKAAAGPENLRRHPDEEPGPAVLAYESYDEDLTVEHIPEVNHVIDNPLDIILDYILENTTDDVKFALAHTDHVYALFGDDLSLSTFADDLMRLSPEVKVHGEIATLELHDEAVDMARHENVPASQMFTGTSQAIFGAGNTSSMDDRFQSAQDFIPDNDDALRRRLGFFRDSKSALRPSNPNMVQFLSDTQDGEECPFAMSPNGDFIATGSANAILCVWDCYTGIADAHFSGHTGRINTIAFDCTGTLIVSGSEDKTAIIWHRPSRSPIARLVGHTQPVWCAKFSPDASIIATGSSDLTIRLWDSSGTMLRILKSHHSKPVMSFTPNGKRLVSHSADSLVFVWDTESGSEVTRLQGHESIVWAVAVSPDSRRVITGSEDTTCRIWNIETGDELITIHEHNRSVWSVDYSPDGQRVVSCSRKKIVVSSATTGDPLYTMAGHTDVVHVVAFSPRGKYIGSGSGPSDTSTRVWDAQTGTPVAVYEGHLASVNQVMFTPEEDRILSGAEDGSVRIWDI